VTSGNQVADGWLNGGSTDSGEFGEIALRCIEGSAASALSDGRQGVDDLGDGRSSRTC
jgi:hypothetical protein